MTPSNVVRTSIVTEASKATKDAFHVFLTVKSDATPADKAMNTAETTTITYDAENWEGGTEVLMMHEHLFIFRKPEEGEKISEINESVKWW